MTADAVESDHDDLIVEHSGFEQVPSSLYLDTSITDGELRLWIILSDRGGAESRAVPKRRTLAKMLGVKSPRTVDARIDGLVAKGWLLKTPRFREDTPGMTSNRYTLLRTPIRSDDDPRLAKHARAVAAFHAEMTRRRGRNQEGDATPAQNSATPPGAADCEGVAQQTAPPPAQNSAHQEPDLFTDPDSSKTHSDPSLRSGSAGDGPAATTHETPAGRKARLDAESDAVTKFRWDERLAAGLPTPVAGYPAVRGIVKKALNAGFDRDWVSAALRVAMGSSAVTVVSLEAALETVARTDTCPPRIQEIASPWLAERTAARAANVRQFPGRKPTNVQPADHTDPVHEERRRMMGG